MHSKASPRLNLAIRFRISQLIVLARWIFVINSLLLFTGRYNQLLAQDSSSNPSWQMNTAIPNLSPPSDDADADSDSAASNSVQSQAVVSTGSATTITQDLETLAANLNYDPVTIFSYVRNKVRFQPYFGSAKGAEVTYLDSAGNDYDQASLLIALLNASGYTSTSYVSGTYTVPGDSTNGVDLAHWVGTKSDLASVVLGMNNVPITASPGTSGSNYTFTHYWVRTSIGGSTYDLDPSFKMMQSSAGIDVKSASGYSRTQLLSDAGGYTGPESYYSYNLNRANIESDLSQWAVNLADYIKQNYQNASIGQIMGGYTVLENKIATLADGAPPSNFLLSSNPPFNVIPSNNSATVQIQVGSINKTFNADSLQGNRLSLIFNSSGNAQLWYQDQEIQQDSSSVSGNSVPVVITVSHPTAKGVQPSINPESVTVNYSRSGRYDLTYSFYGNPDSTGQIDASLRRVENYLASGSANNSRSVVTETLHSLGLQWARRVELVNVMVSQLRGDYGLVNHIFGRSAQEGGYYVDMPGVFRDCLTDQGAGGVTTDTVAFDAECFLDSAMEHGVIEQNGGKAAVSTVKCLANAIDQGQVIWLASASNFDNIAKSQLTGYSSSAISAIGGYTANGGQVLVQQKGNNTLNQWTGYGFASFSGPATSMIIAGGYSGGYDTVEENVTDTYTPSWYYSIPPLDTVTPDNVAPELSFEPVDLLTGAYTTQHTDMTVGIRSPTRGLNFTRYYDSSQNFVGSMLGNGWRNSCEGNVIVNSDLDSAFGSSLTADAAATIVGAIATSDLSDTSNSVHDLLVGILAANWTVNGITNNTANVQIGNDIARYRRVADGSWDLPPGGTTTLTGTSGNFTLLPRFGGKITFDGSNRISQWIDTDNNAESYTYTGAQLSSVTDCYNRSLTFSYYTSGVGKGLLQAVSDSTGRTISFNYVAGSYPRANLDSMEGLDSTSISYGYDSDNHMTMETSNDEYWTYNNYDSLGRVDSQSYGIASESFVYLPGETLEYDGLGNCTTHLFDSKNRNIGTIDALGNASSIGYDSQNHVVSTLDATGRQKSYVYDGNQNLSTITVSGTGDDGIFLSATTRFYYDGSFRLQYIYDPTGHYSQYGYDSNNHLTDMWDPGRRHTHTEFRAGGLMDHVTDQANNTTSYTAYDSYGNPTQITRADGSHISATYNSLGDPLSTTDGRTFTTYYTYFDRRLLETRKDPYGNTTSFNYSDVGYPETTIDRNNHTSYTEYDPYGHLLNRYQTDTGRVTFLYNSAYWLKGVSDVLLHTSTNSFDLIGRTVASYNAYSVLTGSTAYDNAGRVTAMVDGCNNGWLNSYDGLGRPFESKDPMTNASTSIYDLAGRLTQFTDRRQFTFNFGYGPDGLLSSGTYPTTRNFQIAGRDPDGRPISLISPGQNQTTLSYDGLGRTGTSSDAVGTVSISRDGEGNPTDIVETSNTNTEVGGDIHRVFDKIGRITSFTDVSGNTIAYGYDNEREITSIVYPGNKSVTYTYDGSNRIKTVTDWANRVTTYNYDAAGRLSNIMLPNGIRHRVDLDNANRLRNSYDELIQSGSVTNTIWQAGYTYYNNNKLCTYSPNPGSSTIAPQGRLLAYDHDDRIQTFNGQSIDEDSDGNMKSAPTGGTSVSALNWDKRNRLTYAGGISYTYDSEGRRLTSTLGGNTTYYIVSRVGKLDQVLEKLNPDNSVTRYVYGDGLLYEENTSATGTTTTYYHYNWRGDTVALSDSNGNVTARLAYDPFGKRTIVSGTVSTPFCFGGRWGAMTDTNGLVFMQARFYSPLIGRFLNEDPSGFSGGGNLYAYAGGDPENAVDPLGLCSTPTQGGQTPDITFGDITRLPMSAGINQDDASSRLDGNSAALAENIFSVAIMLAVPEEAIAVDAVEAISAEAGISRATGVFENRLVTASNEAVFWSGIGTPEASGADIAAAWAKQNGGATLESTLAEQGIELPAYNADDPEIVAAWKQASKEFAAGASGDVRVLQSDSVRIGSTWADTEWAALKANENVTSITAVHPETGEEVLLWAR